MLQIEINLATLHKAEGSSTGRPGLVKRKVKVHRGGKVFEQYRWVKSGDDEPTERKGAEDKPVPKPKKELVIVGLNKPKEETGAKPKPKEKAAKGLPKSKSFLLKDKAKSVEEATKMVEDAGWVFDHESDIFPDVKDYASEHTPINTYTNEKGEMYGMSQYAIDDFYEDEPIVAEIEYLEVNTPMRGKGYGKRLIAHILKDLLDRKCESVKLDSLDKDSNKFYDAIGMKSIKTGKYTGDAKWMKKFVKENT